MHNRDICEIMFNLIPLLDQKFVRPVDQQCKTIASSLQLGALSILVPKDATMTELSNELLMSKQQLTPMIDKLVAKNLVQRKYDSNDRRLITINITPLGLELLDTIKENALKILADRFSSLDNTDTQNLHEALTTVYSIVQKIR